MLSSITPCIGLDLIPSLERTNDDAMRLEYRFVPDYCQGAEQ